MNIVCSALIVVYVGDVFASPKDCFISAKLNGIFIYFTFSNRYFCRSLPSNQAKNNKENKNRRTISSLFFSLIKFATLCFFILSPLDSYIMRSVCLCIMWTNKFVCRERIMWWTVVVVVVAAVTAVRPPGSATNKIVHFTYLSCSNDVAYCCVLLELFHRKSTWYMEGRTNGFKMDLLYSKFSIYLLSIKAKLCKIRPGINLNT